MGNHQDANTNGDDEINYVSASITSLSFGKYLGDTDTDTENSTLPPSRHDVWYCKLRTCPSYYSASSCKSNFPLPLYETPVRPEDPSTNTRKGQRQWGGAGGRRQHTTLVSLRRSHCKSLIMSARDGMEWKSCNLALRDHMSENRKSPS